MHPQIHRSQGAVVLVALFGVGCASSAAEVPMPKRRPLGVEKTLARAPRPATRSRHRLPGPPPAARPLGLTDRGVFSRFDNSISVEIPTSVSRHHTAIRIDKARGVLTLLTAGVPLKSYPVRFGFTPVGDKVKQGDGRTPEGDYYIAEARHRRLPKRYGARSLLLSYPNVKDARRGRGSGLISQVQYRRIEAAIQAKRIPPQRTPLGSSIRIHGGGIHGHWTLGCVAMRDADVSELYRHVAVSTPVHIAPRLTQADRDGDGIPDQVDLLMGAKKLVQNRSRYHGSYYRIGYPGGDVPAQVGVCSDVIIRALRNAGYDLQKLMYLHIKQNRRSYRWIKQPDRNIDHRRVRNMIVYFKRHYQVLHTRIDRRNRHQFLPGDIVFMDTLPRPGPDHIGIISDTLGPGGYPQVINNWTTGYSTSVMDLLPGVPVTHHFRWGVTRSAP